MVIGLLIFYFLQRSVYISLGINLISFITGKSRDWKARATLTRKIQARIWSSPGAPNSVLVIPPSSDIPYIRFKGVSGNLISLSRHNLRVATSPSHCIFVDCGGLSTTSILRSLKYNLSCRLALDTDWDTIMHCSWDYVIVPFAIHSPHIAKLLWSCI